MSDLTQLLDIRCRCLESPCPPALLLFSLWEASGFSNSASSILSALWPSFQVTVLPGVHSVFGISPCFEWEEGVSAAFIVFPMSLDSLTWPDDHLIDEDDGLPIRHVCLWDSLVTADKCPDQFRCLSACAAWVWLHTGPWSTQLPGNILIDCTTQICNIDAEICERVRGKQS